MTSVAVRVFEVSARAYRRTWKGTAVSTFLSPVLFLTAMGLGLGTLVNRNAGLDSLDGLSYISFLAPGLLAANAMETGASQSAWPVMAGIKWLKTYHAALATPVGVRDLVAGNLAWTAARLAMGAVVFEVISALFGAIPLGAGMLAVLPAILTGLAFAAPVTAYTARSDEEARLTTLFRFGIMPMFLFSGTFFPVSQLPGWLQPVAYATPVWHGVELCRVVALGTASSWPLAAHVLYLVAWMVAGWFFAVRYLEARLKP